MEEFDLNCEIETIYTASTSSAQEASKSVVSHFKDLLDKNKDDTTQIEEAVTSLKEKLLGGVADTDKTIAVRFVECVVSLTNEDEYFHIQLKEILDLIFEHFFEEDMLVKITLIDFVIDICNSSWNVKYLLQNGFLDKILADAVETGDVFGLISRRFIMAIACIHQKYPKEFPISDDYMYFLKRNMEMTENENKDVALNALYLLLQNKDNIKIFIADVEFIVDWLRATNYLSEDIRKSFFLSLRSLLYVPEDCENFAEINPIIFKIFSNITSPENYRDGNGSITEAITYVVKYTAVPAVAEDAKLIYFKLLNELILWQWGYKALFKNEDFVEYILSRKHDETKAVLEAKYEFITNCVQNPLIDEKYKCIDPKIAEGLKNYHKEGIYPTSAPHEESQAHDFHVATEGAG
ncbi:unnamed protein product [Moneuplotes crassus]|uniref:Uncharacterized protein n=1 Tax=Euplotes crassus TaxID=5936 RepID=A0AAD1XFR4_EUPCR|nr:unnamed protein product [Moneuplotes crassus]